MPKPAYTIADLDHALAVVAEYILQSGNENVWCIIDRLEQEKEKLQSRQTKLQELVKHNQNKSTSTNENLLYFKKTN